jgi:hypothetical protein
MPIPRFKDDEGRYDIYLFCKKCGWAVTKDRVTEHWDTCRSCGNTRLVTRKYYHSGPRMNHER